MEIEKNNSEAEFNLLKILLDNKEFIPDKLRSKLLSSQISVLTKDYEYSEQKTYTVQKGDSLYKIAWIHDIKMKELLHLNSITTQSTIYPGQTLYLPTSVIVIQSRLEPKTSNYESKLTQVKKLVLGEIFKTDKEETLWIWPVDGKVVKEFSVSGNQVNKGIYIEAPAGSDVVSSLSGSVVYSGRGLVGFGHLIIIKHENNWLSAYGYTQDAKVVEGDTVKKGQVIAKVGALEYDFIGLHFEIRKGGKPVNPMIYLP